MLEENSLKGNTKLQRAVQLNRIKRVDKMSTASVRKFLLQFQTLVPVKVSNGKDLERKHSQTQTVNSTKLPHFERLCQSPSCVPLLLMMDMLECMPVTIILTKTLTSRQLTLCDVLN